MKTRLLAGLTALVLGGLTSCSNILEENGIPNSVAESGMGELRINLSTDASLNVSTKALDEKHLVKTEISKEAFTIFGRTSEEQSYVPLGSYSNPMTVTATTYTSFQAEYKDEEKNSKPFALNAPHYIGTTTAGSYKVEASGTSPKPSIEAKLKNAVLNFELNNLAILTDITVLQLQLGETYTIENSLSLLNLQSSDEVFVNADRNDIYIYIEGALKADPTKTFKVAKNICSGTQSKTESQKYYQVTYELKSEKGSLTLSLEINQDIYEVPLDVKIDPYNPTTPATE